jgi:membrane peptidoglycan carboxypeptidase
MPNVTQIIRMRQRRRKNEESDPQGRFGLSSALVISLAIALAGIAVTLIYINLLRGIPSSETILTLIEPPGGLLLQPTRFYDRSGQHVIFSFQNPAAEERRYLTVSLQADDNDPGMADDYIAPVMITATVATIDPTFWSNPGFSWQEFPWLENSTLTGRMVSDLLLADEPAGFRRALRDRLLAAQLIQTYGREKVIEWFLNSAYFGNMAYGVDAAAQVYLGKSATNLNLAEAALLAGTLKSPAFNPIDATKTALEGQQEVIQAMVQQGLISSEQGNRAKNTRLSIQDPREPVNELAPAYINLVLDQISPFLSLEALERGGYQIITTLDYDLQNQASCAAEAQFARLKGIPEKETALDGNPCQAALLLPTLTFGDPLSGDLHANVVVLDQHTGQILAMVGDDTPGLDPAHTPGHAPGSMLTPFVYLTAFTRGFNPGSLVWDIPTDPIDNSTQVTNPDGEYHGPIRLRTAMANDYLIPAFKIMAQIGPENALRNAQQMGISSIEINQPELTSQTCIGCELIFDGGEVTLLELTQAFGTIANQGVLVGQPRGDAGEGELEQLEPITLQGIKDIHGQIWMSERAPDNRPVTNAQLSYLITHALSDEAARWPRLGHPNPLEIGRPAAVKLGQSASSNNTWTVGYTPQIVVGTWIGTQGEHNQDNEIVSPKVSAALWHAIIQFATHDLPAEVWTVPPGINTIDVCDPSGMLPTKYCPTIVSEVFLSGNEPTQYDTLYQVFQINRETGRLATVFTPPELIDELVFMIVPEEALGWAQDTNNPSPPKSYDVIYTPPSSENARIDSPAMYTHLGGDVVIRGNASGDDFLSYRLQVGQGLNPKTWLQISDDISTTVDGDRLATWDTTGLNGLFAVQLVVIRSGQRVDTATIQVTVDNQSPEVTIPYPLPDQLFTYALDSTITFQAQASDNISLEIVEFYLGDRLVASQSEAPFAIPWRTSPGEYILRVRAIDLAGNESEATVSFTVGR